MEVNINQLDKLVYKFITKKKPFFIHGAPGIGKSDTVRAVCRRIAAEKKMEFNEGKVDDKKFNLIDVRISQLDPSDIRGIPFPKGENTKWLIPDWLPKGGQGVLFLDEINLAPPSISNAFYQLILEKRVGDYWLPEGWAIIAAGNRATDKCNVFPLSNALKNRFAHATLLPPTHEDWMDWAMENGVKGDIVAFIGFQPNYLFKIDSKGKDDAFPTPRTWFIASLMTEDIEGIGNDVIEEEVTLTSTCVGEGAARSYEGFLKLKKQINIKDILKHPKKVKEITDPGLKWSLISGLAEIYKKDRKKMVEILKVFEYIDPEFGVFLLRLMKSVVEDKQFKHDITINDIKDEVFNKLQKYLF